MKILFIEHPESDLMSALLYTGLCDRFGADNVVDWPYKPIYHGQVDYYYCPTVPGQKTTADPIIPFPWMRVREGRAWSDAEVLSRISEFDLVVLASPRVCNTRALRSLIYKVGRSALRKFVILDGEDYPVVRWDLVEEFRPDTYFKREMIPDVEDVYWAERDRVKDSSRVVLLSLCSPDAGMVPSQRKDIDIFFSGGPSHPFRQQVLDAIKSELGSRLYLRTVEDRHKPNQFEEYRDLLSRSKIAVTARGWSYDSFMFWEIPAFQDTLLVTDKVPLQKQFPFQDGVHAVYYENPQHCLETVRHYASCEPRRSEVARAGNEWFKEHHTVGKRTSQFLEEAMR